MASSRMPTYRATFEGTDDIQGLRQFLDEQAKDRATRPSNSRIDRFQTSTLTPAPAKLALALHPAPRTLPYLSLATPPRIAVILTSQYRGPACYPKSPNVIVMPFSKNALLVDIKGVTDFKFKRAPVRHLEIDLLRPTQPSTYVDTRVYRDRIGPDGPERTIKVVKFPQYDFPPTDLCPLTLIRTLTYLKIEGMMDSYQAQIWQCVWLNPHLHTLILGMSVDGEILSSEEMRVERLHADLKPSSRRIAQGHQREYVPEKLAIVKLQLTNFVVIRKPFELFFDGKKLKEVRLIHCKDAGFRLVGEEWATTTVVSVPDDIKMAHTSSTSMSSTRRRCGTADFRREGWVVREKDIAFSRQP